MSKTSTTIIIAILAAAAILFFRNHTEVPKELPQAPEQAPQPVKNEPTLMSKKDRTGMTIANFAKVNLVHHFARNKDEYWCRFIGQPEEYILKNMTPVFDENIPSESDKSSGVDFEVLVTIQCQSYRVKHGITKHTREGNTVKESKEVVWSDWRRGTPPIFRTDLFKIQRINGKYLWVPISKVTPL